MNHYEFINYSLKRVWNLSAIYYTIWGLVLQIFYYLGVLKGFQESILLVVLTVSFVGLVITYIYPRNIKLRDFDITLTGYNLRLFDLVFHQLPLLIFLLAYDNKIKPDNLILAIGSILVYCILFNPFEVYNMKCRCIRDKKCECRRRYRTTIGIYILFYVVIFLSIRNGIFR
jgi:hypothetical protein